MSFPNPDNYSKDCTCSPIYSSQIPDDYYKTIPAPIVHIDVSTNPNSLSVSYIPNNMRPAWLTTNTEVWLFAYKKGKRKNAFNQYRSGGFRHPVDTTKPVQNTALYGGSGGAENGFTYHTEFPFLVNSEVPDPYVHVPLTGFNVFEFYKFKESIDGITQQLENSYLPLGPDPAADNFGNKELFMFFAYGSGFSKPSWQVKFQLRFVIPNPTTSSTQFPKLMGPPSPIIYAHAAYECSAPNNIITGVGLSL